MTDQDTVLDGIEDENPLEDKTSENNEDAEDLLDGIPAEGEEKEEKDKEDKKSSYDTQKAKYREKYQTARDRVKELEKENADLKKGGDKDTGDDDKERAAKKYISDIARAEIEEARAKEEKERIETEERFSDALDIYLEDNSEVKEDAILDVLEKYKSKMRGLDPDDAIALAGEIASAKKSVSSKKEKPSLPSPGRGSSGSEEKEKIDDSGKTMHQVIQDVISKFKTKHSR